MFVGVADKLTIELGPAFGFGLAFKRAADVEIGARPEFLGDQVLGAVAHSALDVVAVDDKIVVVVSPSAHDDMDVRVVGVPMIDGHPVEAGAEILLGLRHEFSREPLQILHAGGVLGRDDESEVVPVVLGAIGEILGVGVIGFRTEHPRALAVAGDAIPAQIIEMSRKRAALAPVADYERLDGAKACAAGDKAVGANAGGAATGEVRAAARGDLARAGDAAAGLADGGECLSHEGLRALRL